nr:HAMP domain-containing sensor histidine kinase [Saprospiraceae bacterium]
LYMLIALVWWSILLSEKNEEVYNAKFALLDTKLKHEEISGEVFQSSILELQNTYEAQRKMIMGEAIVFGLLLFIGLNLLHNAFSKELEANNKVKNFLLSITHELKSPLSTINLVLETFKKRKLEHEKVIELSDMALSESHRLEKLINDILMSFKLNKSYTYNYEDTNLVEFVNNIVQKFVKANPGIEFNEDYSSPNITLSIDREAFYSLVNNLLENAVKYGEKSPIEISLEESSGQVQIHIADGGIGISDVDKENIFDQFYRVGNEETRRTKGTGLGLFIVKRIVESHNGSIRVENNQPKGTVFIVTLKK